jgi:two-component system sensor histidine kinase KdpD
MINRFNQRDDKSRLDKPSSSVWQAYLWGIVTPFVCTLIDWPLRDVLGGPSILMIYLLGVFLVANFFGLAASILASLLSAPLFAFYFARPIFSFAISDLENMVGLFVMLVVANLTSNLQNKAHQNAELARQREGRTNALYRLSAALVEARDKQAISTVAVQHIYEQFGVVSVLLFANQQGALVYPNAKPLNCSLRSVNLADAQAIFQHRKIEQQNPEVFYYPLEQSEWVFAVLGIQIDVTDTEPNFYLSDFFDTFCTLIAQTLQRLHFAEQAKNAILQAETESLRNALLSAISHDLRTPLTRITGAAGALLESGHDCSDDDKQDFGKVIFDEAQRMSDLTSKILNMARFSSGEIILHQDWNALEEIVGSALNRLNSRIQNRPVRTQLPSNLPLVWVDAVLLEQVLINLIENAIKYTPAGSPIDISAEKSITGLQLVVADYGLGIPMGMEEKVFEKFYSLETETQQGGVGLGLALCRAIIEAHGGSMKVVNKNSNSGAAFIMDLPLREPPLLNLDELGGSSL